MIRTYRLAQGTRVRVRRGRFPLDPTLIGRSGLVVETSEYRPQRYGVVLDEEEAMREFDEAELEPLPVPGQPERVGDPGPGVGS